MRTKHLILDVSVVVDLWLDERSAEQTASLIDAADDSSEVVLWVAAGSLATLDFVARAALKRRGVSYSETARIVPQLMKDLLARVGVLSNHGFEQADVYAGASDFEDAQIAAAARSLGGVDVCIVTEDRSFDTLGELSCYEPQEALSWLEYEDDETTSTGIPFIDLAAQQALIRQPLEKGIEGVLRHGRYIMGPEVGELEARLAEYVGVEHAIAVASGTDALLIALMALEIGPGDEVITSPFSFVATAEVIALLGATPVFVDIDSRTYNIDPEQIESAITANTRAIMPVSLYGQPAEFDAINVVAGKHGLPVIEDAAQSFGATYHGRKSCALSTIGCTSFFPSKPLGGYGDSGACFTSDATLAKKMREIRVHGQDRRYHHPVVGINGRMDALQAAILLPKLAVFHKELGCRQAVAQRYNELLADEAASTSGSADPLRRTSTLTTPWVAPERTSAWAQYTVETPDREALQAALKGRGVPTAVHYPLPLDRQPAFARSTVRHDFGRASAASQRVISLPMHPGLAPREQWVIVDAVVNALGVSAPGTP